MNTKYDNVCQSLDTKGLMEGLDIGLRVQDLRAEALSLIIV